jgi:hypothetical protein
MAWSGDCKGEREREKRGRDELEIMIQPNKSVIKPKRQQK